MHGSRLDWTRRNAGSRNKTNFYGHWVEMTRDLKRLGLT